MSQSSQFAGFVRQVCPHAPRDIRGAELEPTTGGRFSETAAPIFNNDNSNEAGSDTWHGVDPSGPST